MKAYFTIVLICISIISSYSQSGSVKDKLFLDMNIGLGIGQEHYDIFEMNGLTIGSSIATGYQINKWLGLGLGYDGYIRLTSYVRSFSGASFAIRLKPTNKSVVIANYGYLIDFSRSTDAYNYEYVPSRKYYYKISAFLLARKNVSVGLTFVALSGAKFKNCYAIDENGQCIDQNQFSVIWPIMGTLLTFGMSLN